MHIIGWKQNTLRRMKGGTRSRQSFHEAVILEEGTRKRFILARDHQRTSANNSFQIRPSDLYASTALLYTDTPKSESKIEIVGGIFAHLRAHMRRERMKYPREERGRLLSR